MGAIEHLTISLPVELAARLRLRVAGGEFSDISEAVAEALEEFEADRASNDGGSPDEWLRHKIRSALAEYDADPTCVMTAEQVRGSLAAARLERANGRP